VAGCQLLVEQDLARGELARGRSGVALVAMGPEVLLEQEEEPELRNEVRGDAPSPRARELSDRTPVARIAHGHVEHALVAPEGEDLVAVDQVEGQAAQCCWIWLLQPLDGGRRHPQVVAEVLLELVERDDPSFDEMSPQTPPEDDE
jgi:hypothetical protein